MLQFQVRGLAGLLLALAVAACAVSNPSPIESGIMLALPDSTSSVQSGDQKIAPLDVIEVKVFGVPDLNGVYQVDPAGQIKIPLVGVVEAQGLNVFDLASALEKRLAENLLQVPQVTVRISELYGQQVTVDGAIRSPGVYPVKGTMTLLQAIAVSGGPAENANPNRVIIFRTIEGERKAAAFDLIKIRNGTDPDPRVYGNDTIVVDGSDVRNSLNELARAIPLLGLFMSVY